MYLDFLVVGLYLQLPLVTVSIETEYVKIRHTPQYPWIFMLYGTNYSEEWSGQLPMDCINYMNFRLEVQRRALG